MTAMDHRPTAASALVGQVEGHLLIEATLAEGRAEAARFARRFTSLTDTERQEIEERYAAEHLALAQRSWQRTALRAREVRAEYEERYRLLRRRLWAGFLLGGALVLVLLSAGVLLGAG